MPSGLNSTVQIQSPGQGLFDLMKSTSSVNSMTSGNVPGEKIKPAGAETNPNYVNIVSMPKSGIKTARKLTNKSEVKSPNNPQLSETLSPGILKIPALNHTTSVQSTKPTTSNFQTNLKPSVSAKPAKPASSFKPKPPVKGKN